MKPLLLMTLCLLFQFIAADEDQRKLNQSFKKELESYDESYDQTIQFMNLCADAKLTVFVNPNYNTQTVAVSFELTDSKHKNCFSYFYIFLKSSQHQKSAKVPYAGELNQAPRYKFKNVTCGVYSLSIAPYYNSWQYPHLVIKYPEKINMTNCLGSSLLSNSNFQEHHEGILSRQMLTVSLFCSLVFLTAAGAVCCLLVIRLKYLPSYLPTSLTELETKSGFIECSEVNKLKREVFFINYHDRNTLKEVAALKECILAHCPGAYISGIGNLDDFNDFLTDSCSWLDKKLKASREKDIVRKIILVDSIGKMEEEIHENENEAFMDAIEKLYRNFAGRRFDYTNVFIVHFGHSRIHMDKLSNIVEDIRYLIPDHLGYLCHDLLVTS